ncbi:Dak kinase [Hortaea werneckii]|nr:Dak kinase [Hortaea werneckii]
MASSAPKRMAQIVRLKPESLQEYKECHNKAWPEVLQQIKDCHIVDYSIWFDDRSSTLFATMKWVGNDFDADMAKMAANPKVQEWWAMTDSMQESYVEGAKGSTDPKGWWKPLEEVFRGRDLETMKPLPKQSPDVLQAEGRVAPFELVALLFRTARPQLRSILSRSTSGLSPIYDATMATETQTKQQPAKETFHFVNDPRESINDALTGLTYLKPSLSYNKEYKTIYRNDLSTFAEDHVTTIGFAGGGHEPMFGGFVGDNYLTAYVSGNVFASPTAAQIFEAIKMCQPRSGKPGKGTMVVCGNYTGDILNAGLAITRAQAAGFKVHFCPIGDDVAVGRKKGGKVGRRGLSGHLIALKNACALAQKGESLERVAEVMEYVAANVGTIGVAFDRVALPNATLTDLQTLPPATIELGMGAHGEPGLQQISPIPTPENLTTQMLDLLLNVEDKDRAFIPFSASKNPKEDNEVVMLLNSLGSTSDEVLARFAELAQTELEKRGFVVRRLTLGPLVTSLKMSGFGITLWRLPKETGEKLERKQALQLWDEPVDVVSWRQ